MQKKVFLLLILFITNCFCTVYFKETFRTALSLKSWVKPVSPSSLGDFSYYHLEDDLSDFRGITTIVTFKNYRITRQTLPFKTYKKTLIFQFEVKFPDYYECGGGFMKLLPTDYNALLFSNKSPYLIKFGPDVCGFKKKILLTLNINGTYHELKVPLKFEMSMDLMLFSLTITPFDTYIIKINMTEIAKGKISEDFENLPEEFIPDGNLTAKPITWDDRETIFDKSDRQPVYWNDEMVPDPQFNPPPDYFDSTEDWDIPKVPNKNTAHPWLPRQIKNLNYSGKWLGNMEKNSKFSNRLHDFNSIGGVGIDIWQPYAGVLFDNILLTDDIAVAEAFAKEKWAEVIRIRNHEAFTYDLATFSSNIQSSEIARSKLDNEKELSDHEFTSLNRKHNRKKPKKMDLKPFRNYRRKNNEIVKSFGKPKFTVREFQEALIDIDSCLSFASEIFIWRKNYKMQIPEICGLKKRSYYRPTEFKVY